MLAVISLFPKLKKKTKMLSPHGFQVTIYNPQAYLFLIIWKIIPLITITFIKRGATCYMLSHILLGPQ